MTTLTVRQAAERLRAFDNVLVLTHLRPDGDTVGSAAALCAGLRALGKTAYLLPNPELTDTAAPYFRPYAAPEGFTPERVVSTDIATTALFPENAKPYADRVDLAIDHHPSFEGFGRENVVRPSAAATGEIIYSILAALGPITAEMALPLYVAVSTDCGCFAYGNTTAQTHAVAAALLQTGIDFQAVNKTFFRTKSRKRLALEAAMLSGIEYHDQDRVAVLAVPLSLIAQIQATETDAEDLSALGGQIEGVDCAVTMRELRPDVWKFSLRTGPRVNATRACALLGGGGHAAAAGCTVEAPFQEAKRRMLEAIAQTAPDFTL
nr:DHH family phosphoesterase [uncultured Oscillibacter sp.]